MPRIILHIGTYKTGSTAIQSFMRRNASHLEEIGLFYPRFPGDPQSHTFLGLSIYRKNLDGIERCLASVREAVERNPDATIVLSSEHFWPMQDPELREMLDRLAAICPNVQTLIYLRPQDHLWASLYAQQAKNMSVLPEHALWGKTKFIGPRISSHGMYYFECLEAYASRFGRANIAARLYDREAFAGHDVVDDFFRFLGTPIPDTARRGEVVDANVSFGWKAVAFAKLCAVEIGRVSADDPAPPAMRDAVHRLAQDEGRSDWYGRTPNYLPEDEVARIREHYRPSNERLFASYFGGRDVFAGFKPLTFCPFGIADIPPAEMRSALAFMEEALRGQEAAAPGDPPPDDAGLRDRRRNALERIKRMQTQWG